MPTSGRHTQPDWRKPQKDIAKESEECAREYSVYELSDNTE